MAHIKKYPVFLEKYGKRVSPQLPLYVGGGYQDHILRAIELKLGM